MTFPKYFKFPPLYTGYSIAIATSQLVFETVWSKTKEKKYVIEEMLYINPIL